MLLPPALLLASWDARVPASSAEALAEWCVKRKLTRWAEWPWWNCALWRPCESPFSKGLDSMTGVGAGLSLSIASRFGHELVESPTAPLPSTHRRCIRSSSSDSCQRVDLLIQYILIFIAFFSDFPSWYPLSA
ncbi:hypothetical protein EDB81DRAFT_492644 [Dactylonectria macrodidyma]|uniref:Uncharacterized protein n=1 Tax=Dactylonectria macrodidyma TaxID=307937 RepID=A0A9P9EWR5_9HYPO|nr:hypothetical protein EDB81DRAFT_492644 [Dactylonectria macrodidyma]